MLTVCCYCCCCCCFCFPFVVSQSTLFNALTDTQLAQASNFPFTTIEPNTAAVAVPDPLLQELAKIAGTTKLIYPQVKFVDIAGLIKGASSGAGLGNKFLTNIKDVDVILHVVRCFEDPEILHVDSRVDPIKDIECIETELLLADLQTVEKRIENAEKNKGKTEKKSGNASALTAADRLALYQKLRTALNEGIPIVDCDFTNNEERSEVESMQLITSKPLAYVCNVDEKSTKQHNAHTKRVFEEITKLNNTATAAAASTSPASAASSSPSPASSSSSAAAKKPSGRELAPGVYHRRIPRALMRVCAQLESEVQSLGSEENRKEFLAMNDLECGSLNHVIRTANELLQLTSYYTVGEKEARSWSIALGTNAQEAAGKIHSDLSKGFICAEVIKPKDFIQFKGEQGCKAAGAIKVEGKAYIVQPGDIMNFRVQGQKSKS